MTSVSGGIDLDAQGDVNIGGDVVGRDKIIQNIQNIDQRARTAAEEAEQARTFEAQRLAQGVSAFARRLPDRAGELTSAGKGGPYKNLLEYRLSDAEIFFGRDQAIRELLEHLPRSPLTVLHAESGAGKTSLLQAGISPRLIAAGHLPIWLRPYNVAPALALKRAFLPNLSDTPQLAQAPLRDFLSRVSNVLGTATTLYIYLDQFEEFFTRLDETARPKFVSELAECLEDESLNVCWVLALRSEYFGNLASFRPRIRNPFENDYRLNRLTRAEAREAMVRPAAQCGLSFEDGLIELVLSDLGQDEVEPPQVQLVCSTLYETLSSNMKVITREQYVAQGGAAGILRDHLGRVLKRLPAEQRPIAQRLLEELITSDLHRVMRTRAELANTLAGQGVNSEILDVVLGHLIDNRLLRVEEVGDEPAYELAHDYLLGEIDLDPAVQARKAAQELLEQETRTYQRYGTLLSDDKLAILAPRRHELVLSTDAQILIHKSEQALKRRQRLVFGGIGLVVALILIGLISIASAIGARQQQQVAIQTQHLAETEAAQANTQKADAVASAAAAQALQAKAEAGASSAATREAVANESLRRAFEQTGIVPVGKGPSALAYDPQRGRLWVANQNDNTVQAIDPISGTVIFTIKTEASPGALAFDETRLWVANTASGTLQAIDPETGIVSESIAIDMNPLALTFGHKHLWIAGQSKTAPNTYRIEPFDPTTHVQGERIPLPAALYPNEIAVGGEQLWIATNMGGLQGYDPVTGRQVGEPTRPGVAVEADATIFDGQFAWVVESSNSAHEIRQIDPATGYSLHRYPGSGYGRVSSMLFDQTKGRLLWIANKDEDAIRAFDLATHLESQPIVVGNEPIALTNANGQLWVANSSDNTIQKVNLGAGLAFEPIHVGNQPNELALDQAHDQLWVTNSGDGTVQSIDINTGKVGNPIPTADRLQFPISDPSHVWKWAIDENGVLQVIDPKTGKVAKTIEPDGNMQFDHVLASSDNWLWASGTIDSGEDTIPPALFGVDLDSREIVWSQLITTNPNAVVFDGSWLWVASTSDNRLRAFDPYSGKIGPNISVGNSPAALVYDGKRIWVANQKDNTVQYVTVYK